MKIAIAGVAFALVAGPATAQVAPATDPMVSAAAVRSDAFPQVETRYPGGIVAWPHVEFANYIGFRPLQLDLYLHADRARAARRPLVVWVHGGGWNRGDARGSGAFSDFPAVLAGIAARGYVVASVDYRLSGEARFPAQVQDVKAAIRFLRSDAAAFGIDPDRVVLWGRSAGGHLAALAAATCGVAAFDPPASTGRLGRSAGAAASPLAVSDCVQGAAIWYGLFDLDRQPEGDTDIVAQLLGCARGSCRRRAVAASPISYVGAATPPMLLIHGTADTEVSHRQTEAMTAAMRAAGRPVQTALIPDIGHGFIGKTPAATRDASRSALDRTLRFIGAITSRSGAPGQRR